MRVHGPYDRSGAHGLRCVRLAVHYDQKVCLKVLSPLTYTFKVHEYVGCLIVLVLDLVNQVFMVLEKYGVVQFVYAL